MFYAGGQTDLAVAACTWLNLKCCTDLQQYSGQPAAATAQLELLEKLVSQLLYACYGQSVGQVELAACTCLYRVAQTLCCSNSTTARDRDIAA
jgi:hypothetical protein